jgi:hypothetical protein
VGQRRQGELQVPRVGAGGEGEGQRQRVAGHDGRPEERRPAASGGVGREARVDEGAVEDLAAGAPGAGEAQPGRVGQALGAQRQAQAAGARGADADGERVCAVRAPVPGEGVGLREGGRRELAAEAETQRAVGGV